MDRYEVRRKELFEDLDQDLDQEQEGSEEQQEQVCLQVNPGRLCNECCWGGRAVGPPGMMSAITIECTQDRQVLSAGPG
jgi:hypothetical protein